MQEYNSERLQLFVNYGGFSVMVWCLSKYMKK